MVALTFTSSDRLNELIHLFENRRGHRKLSINVRRTSPVISACNGWGGAWMMDQPHSRTRTYTCYNSLSSLDTSSSVTTISCRSYSTGTVEQKAPALYPKSGAAHQTRSRRRQTCPRRRSSHRSTSSQTFSSSAIAPSQTSPLDLQENH
jgi:hypothetical protein